MTYLVDASVKARDPKSFSLHEIKGLIQQQREFLQAEDLRVYRPPKNTEAKVTALKILQQHAAEVDAQIVGALKNGCRGFRVYSFHSEAYYDNTDEHGVWRDRYDCWHVFSKMGLFPEDSGERDSHYEAFEEWAKDRYEGRVSLVRLHGPTGLAGIDYEEKGWIIWCPKAS